LETASTIEDADDKTKALVKLAGKYAEAGQKEQAAQILSQALETVRTIDNSIFKSWVLAEIVSTYTEAGQQPSKSDMAKLFDIVKGIHPIGVVLE
ncbi:MAG: hypothetical protein JW725_00745, partial [Candidatus Babeliaceae bacterium]|nr:hypothetical protein [Candidatus Babeliaceae bacterium]